jgi:hypothetical protein
MLDVYNLEFNKFWENQDNKFLYIRDLLVEPNKYRLSGLSCLNFFFENGYSYTR